MTHRGFAVGGDLAELAARLGRAPSVAASVEAERTVEFRERLRQERLEAERAAELDRQRADQLLKWKLNTRLMTGMIVELKKTQLLMLLSHRR